MSSLCREVIDQQIDKLKALNQLLSEAYSNSRDLAVMLAEADCEGTTFEEGEELAQQLADLEGLVAHHIAALGFVRDRVKKDGAAALDLVAQFDEKIALQRKPSAKIADLRRRIWGVRHPGQPLPEEADQEVVMIPQRSPIDLLCPLTKSLLEHPMKKSVSPLQTPLTLLFPTVLLLHAHLY